MSDTSQITADADLFRLVVEAAPNAMVMINSDGIISLVNSQTERIFGYSRSEMIGEPVEMLVNMGLRERHVKYRDAYLIKPEVRSMGAGRELLALRKNGTEFPVEIGLNPIPTNKGVGVLAAIVDISERRKAEQEREELEAHVRHSQKLESLGVLAGGIAHDFNNLLAAILGNAEIAQARLPMGSPASNYIQNILTASQRAAELTRQMLAYSGRGRFEVKRINVSKAVEEMSELLRVTLSKKAELKFSFDEQTPEIEVDSAQFNQVLLNLITNANEALPDEGGIVSVSTGLVYADSEYLSSCAVSGTTQPGAYAYIEVSDTGSGMSTETLSRIFDPFFTTKFTGRGLGLSAVLGIVRGHCGAIKVDSIIGRGTSFKVLLPAPESHPTGKLDSVLPAQQSDKLRKGYILLADDEELVRHATGTQLESMGFSVIHAVNGKEAVLLQKEYADKLSLAILDLTMPQMDGDEAARQIIQTSPDLPIILTSGYSTQDLSMRLRDNAKLVILPKPASLVDLGNAIREALSHGETRKS
ncbi:MAG: PAS domain S-box protein [Pseudohongiellaceae bacterium]|nr:PAS domain S-box protein [Pseudohongiellaceae bacterium]